MKSAGKARKLAQRLWAAAGFIAFGLGFLGAILPLIPTTPFILLAAFCFARSSEKLNEWFKGTKLYKLVFESYMQRRSMTLKAKLTLLAPISVLLAISFVLLESVPVMRVVVVAIWAAHLIYFGFAVKTERPEIARREGAELAPASE